MYMKLLSTLTASTWAMMPIFLILLMASSCLGAVASVLKVYGSGFHLARRGHLFNKTGLRREALTMVDVKLMLAIKYQKNEKP